MTRPDGMPAGPETGQPHASTVHEDGTPVGRLDTAFEQIRFADEARHETTGRPLVEILGRAELGDPPAVHQRDPVGHGERFFLVMGDVEYGHPHVAVDALDLELHLLAQIPVEGAERLVHEEESGVEHEGAGEGDPLLLASGELPGQAVAQPVRCTMSRLRPTCVRISACGRPRILSGKATLSKTFM